MQSLLTAVINTFVFLAIAYLAIGFALEVADKLKQTTRSLKTVTESLTTIKTELKGINTTLESIKELLDNQPIITTPAEAEALEKFIPLPIEEEVEAATDGTLDETEIDALVQQFERIIAEEKPVLDLQGVKVYKLRKKDVVPVEAVTFSIPDTIKRYLLRGKEVVTLEDLEREATVIYA